MASRVSITRQSHSILVIWLIEALRIQTENQAGLEVVTFSGGLEFNPNAQPITESRRTSDWEEKSDPQPHYKGPYERYRELHEAPATPAVDKSGRIWGLRRTVFISLAIFIAAVITVGAAVGGVVGYENSKSSTSSVALPPPPSKCSRTPRRQHDQCLNEHEHNRERPIGNYARGNADPGLHL